MKRWFSAGRFWDALALLLIAFVAWKLLFAPRSLNVADAYPAPPTSFARLDGGKFVVRAQRGRVLFLDFYASWCEPCKVELPIVEAWAKRHPQALVLPVDVGEPRAVVEAFARGQRLGDVAYDASGHSGVMYALGGFPTVVVIDPQSRVRAKWEGLNPAISLAMDNAERELGP